MRKLFITCLFLIICFPLFSLNIEWTDGYIITQENDTIYGQIGKNHDEDGHLSCYFRHSSNSESIIFYPNQLKEYRTNRGLTCRSLKIQHSYLSGHYFVEYILEGRIELYYIEIPSRELCRYILKRKDTGDIITIKNFDQHDLLSIEAKKTKNTLNLFLYDWPEAKRELHTMTCSRDSYIRLLTKYHNYVCKDEVCIIYSEKKPLRKHYIGIYAGGTYSPIDLKLPFNSFFSHSFSPLFAVEYSTSIERFNNKTILHTGLDFSKLTIKELIVNHYGKYNAYLSAMKVNASFLVEHRYFNKSTIPGTFLGISIESFFNEKEKELPFYYNGFNINARIGIGVAFPLKNNKEIPLRLLYQRSILSWLLDEHSVNNSNSIILSAGYRFKL